MINFNPNAIKTNDDVLRVVSCNVLEASQKLPEGSQEVKGYDFSDESVDYDALLKSYYTTGFQATNFAIAVDIIKDMLDWRPSKAQIEDDTSPDARCSIFLGYTSNMVSSGVRETIKFLVKTKQVDVIVTTAGAIEEDIMKCLAPTGLGDFRLDGAMLREKGLNRIGNLLIPNNNYCNFEDWCLPVLDKALEIQKKEGIIHTPSSIIKLFGENIHNEDSVLYWAAKNGIPVFCPAITDGAIGDLMFIHSIKNPGLIVDLVQDIGNINRLSIRAAALGMIIVGGGIIKHHICNAALMRNGANFAVYVNTGQEFDGSDAGASPEEAVSWGKIEPKARRVKICADATLILPLLVAQTFAQKDRKNGRN